MLCCECCDPVNRSARFCWGSHRKYSALAVERGRCRSVKTVMNLLLTVFVTPCLADRQTTLPWSQLGKGMVWCEPSTWAWRNWHISQMENQFYFSCICYILCSEIDDFLYSSIHLYIHTSIYTYNSYIIIICFCALVFCWLQFNWIGIYKLENVINIETVELIICCLFLGCWLRLPLLSLCSLRSSWLLKYLRWMTTGAITKTSEPVGLQQSLLPIIL